MHESARGISHPCDWPEWSSAPNRVLTLENVREKGGLIKFHEWDVECRTEWAKPTLRDVPSSFVVGDPSLIHACAAGQGTEQTGQLELRQPQRATAAPDQCPDRLASNQ